MSEPFVLQHGRRYVTRDGRVTDGVVWDMRQIGVAQYHYPFIGSVGGSFHSWTINGDYSTNAKNSASDLVREFVDPPPPKWVPFTQGETEPLLLRTIRRKSWLAGSIATILYVADDRVMFMAGVIPASIFLRELFDEFEFADGTPCGKQVPQ